MFYGSVSFKVGLETSNKWYTKNGSHPYTMAKEEVEAKRMPMEVWTPTLSPQADHLLSA